MKKYKVYMTQLYVFYDVEADSPEEARDIVTDSYIWDDHFVEMGMDIEEVEE